MAGNPLLDLPVSSNPLLELVPEKPKAPTATEGFLGKVGDFIVDNLGGVSATMRENARTGTFAQDAATDQGFFDRAGSLIERGAASFDQGLYNFLGGLGSQKARDAARSISAGTTSKDVAGTTSWEDVNSAGSLGSYVLDAGIESAPAMGALAVPFVGPLSLTASQTGNIASERARNNGRDFITEADLGNSAPAAILSTALDRLGLKGIKNPVGKAVTGRVLGAATREGLTEAAQSGIEYTGGTLGTDAGFNLGTALNQMLAGGAAGFGMGGAGRVAMEPVDAFMARRGGSQPQTGQGEPIDSDWEGSLDDLLAPEQQAAPANPLLALPAPAAYVDSLGDTAIGSDGLTQLERTRAERRINAGKPEGNPIDAFMRKARGAESAGDDGAKNPRSSATGRYQFIDSTWLATYRQEFPNTGETDAQILAKRGDGRLQDRLMRRLTQGNAATLQGAGIPVDTGNLYLAHFAGPAGALALHRNPNASVETILGKSVIKANPFLKGMTGADVIQWAAGKMGGGGGTGFTSRAGNALDGMPEIDMPMPQRRDNNTAVLPELSGQDFRVAPIAPEQAQNAAAQPAQQQNDNQPAQPAIERQPLPEAPPARRGAISQVVAPRVGPVDTMFELRDMAELVDSSNPAYDKTLQPRDRAGRAASGAQVASIAGTLDPRQLADSRLASTGAPIIGPDGQVESGNGRIAALRQVYAQFPEQAAAYRQMIADTGLDATGLQFPVLVRRRTTEMTPEQRQAWTRAANERDTMAMSSTEQATADARQLPDSTLSLYRGGPVTAAGNRDFVRAFIERAVAPAERNAMVAPDGSLSVDGARRIRFALLARAYGDSELIGRIAEDTDTNIAAIGKALLEAAPAMAKLRAGIDAGEIPPQYDISANIAEAARMVARSRDTGQSLQGMLAQTDAFVDPIAPETEAVLRLFYNDEELKRARSAVKIADDLIEYARLAETQAANAAQGNDMFGNAPVLDSPATLLQRVRSGDDAAQGDMLAPAPESAYAAPDEQGSRPDRQTAPARPAGVERDGGSRAAVPTLARGQLRALGIAAQLRTEKAAALVGRTASTPRELAEIAQVYRDPRYETFRIFLTKGDTIVHATGVSSRSVDQAPLMPKDMKSADFIASVKQTMAETGADGYYLLHNHPSGEPDPSRADMKVTRDLAGLLPGFRAHIVINSNKYATINLDAAGRTRSKVSKLNDGEDKLIAASKPHDVLGRPILRGGDLSVLGKELQKPGWITVIGTDSKGRTRVVVDYPASTAKKDVRSLMAMARRIQTQSGSSSLFLVGDKDALDNPTVKRAIGGGIVTAAIDMDGKEVAGTPNRRNAKIPKPPARFVAEEAQTFGDTINVNGEDRPTVNSNGQPIARDEAALRNFWNWFGDSKVVDAQGRPLVVYHGTTADFEAFDNSKTGANDRGLWGRGHYFSSVVDNANSYALRQGDGARIIPAYVALQNPLVLKTGGDLIIRLPDGTNQKELVGPNLDGSKIKERAQSGGHDGVIQIKPDGLIGDLVAYQPTQIKSVNNRGTFDPADPRILMEDTAPFDRSRDPGPSIADGLVDRDGLTRDVQKIRDIVGNPVQALKGIMRSGLADNVRALTYSMDSRMRAFAKKYNSPAITELANHFYALAGTGEGPVTETYHEAVEREGFGRAGQALRILEPFIGDKAAMERITRMLRLPGERARGKRAEAEAAARIARLLKDTLDYRREAGEDIGEVTTGYFPRMLDVEKVVQNREAFLRNATELFRIHDAPNPRASAEAWLARTFDQYAGIDGGLDLIDLFHDTRPAGVGRRTTKPRKFGEDADRLLGSFYQNDTGEVLTAYFIGGAKRAEEARRFGGEKMKTLFDRIQEDIRVSGLDGGDAAGALARMVATNLGRVETPSERVRGTVSFLQTASQLGTLDRALITSLSESMMGFVRGGARHGLPMLIRSAREFARQVRKAPPSEAARMAEALGIAQDALIGEALAARSGFERGQTSRRAQKVQQGFFRANGLEQWTTGTRAAATKMGQEALYYLATDMASGRARNAAKYLNELGITDPRGFSRWLLDGGNPTPEQLIGQEVSPNAREYRTALLRFVNQTIMKPSRAEKPRWASHPVLGMFFSLMSYSYGFKKNVLDRAGRMIARGAKEKDPSLLYPAFGLAALFATHTVINNVIRQAILGGGREDEEEGITFTDWVEALDRAGLFGAASPLINAAFGVRYNRSLTESLAGPVVGRPLDAATKIVNLGTDRNSPNTNTGERAAAAALYDVALEPALEAYGVTRFKGPAAAAIVWGSGNREGGIVLPDRDIFVEAVAGPKEEK